MRARLYIVYCVISAINLTIAALPAHANFVGNDTQNFNPTTSGLDFVTVESSETLNPGIVHSGLYFNRAYNSLPDSIDPNGARIPSDDSVTFGDLNFGYGLTQRLDLGIGFSYLMDQQTNRNDSGAQFSATGLNEVRLGGKYNFIKRDPFGVALQSSLNLNQTKNNPFRGRGAGPSFNLQGIADYRVENILLALNLGYRYRDRGQVIERSVYEPLPSQWTGSLAASYYFTSADLRAIVEIFAAKSTANAKYVKTEQIATELLAGLNYDVNENLAISGGLGTKAADGLFEPDWRVYAGLNWNFDFWSARVVQINETTEIRQITYKGYMPEDIEALLNVDFDELTKKHEFQLRTTIPEADIAGVKPPFEVIRLENFNFDTASDKIRPEYKAPLEKLAVYLSSHPELLKVRIEGHTDSLGSFERNRKLSARRSDALVSYVKSLPGMAKVRVESAGFGADRPIADNGNYQGRRLNRRVEIRILRRLVDLPSRNLEEHKIQ